MDSNRVLQTSDATAGVIDPYTIAEMLIGRKIDRRSTASTLTMSDYDDLVDVKHDSVLSGETPKPDSPPKNVHVGCNNPYALVEALIGREIDRDSLSSAQIISDVLQTDYDELFDMKYHSVLYAGLKLNDKERKAEELSDKDMFILNERDLETPDLSPVHKIGDLQKLGLKDILQTNVKLARMQNGKLRLVLHARDMGKTVSNREVTKSLNELALPFRKREGKWTPPNSSWHDMYEGSSECLTKRMLMEMERLQIGARPRIGESLTGRPINRFEDPVQGAMGNSWLIAAIFSVFWADPSAINRSTRASDQQGRKQDEKKRVLAIKFHDKGGDNNAPTATVEVSYEIPINNSSNQPIYCHASDGCGIWPALYEKAFTKWMTDTSSDHPDITQTHNGDPVKAMAQINGRDPQYYFTDHRSAGELAGLVRSCSVNFKTINAMCAYTHASGNVYLGSNLVANHAYSVLGWAACGRRQYIILRNPWGVTEPVGLTGYPGLVDRVEPEFWRPASLLDSGGVLALEATAFKEYFACIGVAK